MKTKRKYLNNIIVLVILTLLPLVSPDPVIAIAFMAIVYAMFATGLNIIVGWTGLLDLGAAGFVAVGAYSAAIMLTQFHLPPLLVILLNLPIGFVFGVLLGLPTLRHREDYFAILTMGFAELVALTIRNWPAVTKGSYGYSNIPPTILPFSTQPLSAVPPIGFYYLALLTIILLYYLVRKLRETMIGRYFQQIKENETIASLFGINVIKTKIIAFGTSAAIISLGGFFWASYQRSVVWTEFGILLSCLFIAFIVIGGIGNPLGVIIGAAVIGSLQEVLRNILTEFGLPTNIRFLIFSTILILFILIRPKGILQDKPEWFNSIKLGKLNKVKNKSRQKLKNSEILIEIKNLVKRFGGLVALNNLSFSIRAGETLAIIGPNGSGKTTLLNLLNGLVKRDKGEILYNGKQIHNLSIHKISRLGIGRTLQEISVINDLSIIDNVLLVNDNIDFKVVEDSFRNAGIINLKENVDRLSYGEKKKLDVLRMLNKKEFWDVILLDEPTAGLTQTESLQLVQYLRKLKEEIGFTLVIVSHDVLFLESLGLDRVIVLNKGKMFKEGSYSSIRNDKEVQKIFWGI